MATLAMWITLLVCLQPILGQYYHRSTCTDHQGQPRRCMPSFENAAYGNLVEATNTCGVREPKLFCMQVGVAGATKSCDYCDSRDPRRAHPPSALTDYHDRAGVTAWQSETMLEGVQYPETVNLTLHLGKSFDITYVRLKFHSSRPESFAIYKRTEESGPWIPYQFYSASCEDTYNRRPRELITAEHETIAVCTGEYSDISPLTGGSVAFSTLEGRPSAYDFENTPELQEWVTATDIRIVLTRMNTFGDEVFGDPNVLQSYFYAISDFAVGGRCKCNGHASGCTKSTGQGLQDILVCQCEHHTKGPDCGECDDFYNDRPWQRATLSDAHECQACDCGGMSTRCYFDEELFRTTGNGGHCIECRANTFGVHCERCKDNYYRTTPQDYCTACNCNPTGSSDLQCDVQGICQCKAGVQGDKCDRCMPNYYDFGAAGCRQCACLVAGSLHNEPVCLPSSGICTCKELTEGQNCDTCKPGHFNLDVDNELGCISCFCYGHSSICTSAAGYTERRIDSTFDSDRRGSQQWLGVDEYGEDVQIRYDGFAGNIGLQGTAHQPVWFLAPARYLGDQRFSYDRMLEFSLRVGQDGVQASSRDLIIEGDGMSVSCPIYSQNNPMPNTISQVYNFRLNEHSNYQWTPQLTSLQFIKLLANITAIKIRGSFTYDGLVFLDDVILHSAVQGGYGFEEVSHIEECTCPDGYIGQFCEDCAPGYHREPKHGGPLARCVPCNCNGHSDTCDVDSGRCICQHNTAGDNCEVCAAGWYGYALAGTEQDCSKCPCPEVEGECVEMLNGDVVCINCKDGYTGSKCDICTDGYFGDPQGRHGPPRPCIKCECNDNVDYNAVGNCNSTTGECIKCIYHTHGWECGSCLPGFFGDALTIPKGDCAACNCYENGSGTVSLGSTLLCEEGTGQCPCLPQVVGRQCDTCVDGYWNIDSGYGCEGCHCDAMGSYNSSCDLHTGQCFCKPGVGGQQCNECLPDHWGFTTAGCKVCDCDSMGSFGTQCDERSGQCPCMNNIEGRQCNQCVENMFNLTAGCTPCAPCYNLVQEHVQLHRQKMSDLRRLLDDAGNDPGTVDDAEFIRRMKEVNQSVSELHRDALAAIGSEGPLADQLDDIQTSIQDLLKECGQVLVNVASARDAHATSSVDISQAEAAIESAEERLREAEDMIERDGQGALADARAEQERLGTQSSRMTEIAQQARELAEHHENEAMNIEKTAADALNTSREAFRMATEALNRPERTKDDIARLRQRALDAESTYEQTKQMSENALAKAEEAYQDALDIYSEANSLVLPEVNTQEFIDESELIKSEAARIKEEAATLIEQNQQLMEDVDAQRMQAEELLEDGIRQQQIADELLADADVARDIARDAIAKAEKTISDANSTLNILKEFDAKKQASQVAAEAALTRVSSIEAQIEAAEKTTQDAHTNLNGAETDALAARDIAQEAQSIAEAASQEADRIQEEAEQTKRRAEELKAQGASHARDVEDAQERLGTFQTQAAEDEQLAREALQKADQAKTSADFSSSKVADALEVVTNILTQLANLDSINIADLNKLEENLDEVETQLEEANIEENYQTLYESHQKQNLWVYDYTNELLKLRTDVDNIRAINATIPRGICFNSVALEPTDPTG